MKWINTIALPVHLPSSFVGVVDVITEPMLEHSLSNLSIKIKWHNTIALPVQLPRTLACFIVFGMLRKINV
jgi:hypothetical protein